MASDTLTTPTVTIDETAVATDADSPSSPPSTPPFIFSDSYMCQWKACQQKFDDAELLYSHLRDDHVGRKAKHNLCLSCHWENCTAPTFTKRDHITSHLRVHVSLKPHQCEICRKAFKRPQDLRKHVKTHDPDDDMDSNDARPAQITKKSKKVTTTTAVPVKLLQPNDCPTIPLTPPTTLDHSPSIARASLSPYMPLSPADTAESWNPGLSSPSYSTNSDLFSSPSAQDLDLELELMNPTFSTSGAYYDDFIQNGYEELMSPITSKRSRDDSDMALADSLELFAIEAKRKRIEPSYNKDIMGRLDAISSLLDQETSATGRLLGAFQDMKDWNQVNELNQFCATLLEDVSGEVFEPHAFDTSLFPELNEGPKLEPLDTTFLDTSDSSVFGEDPSAFSAGPLTPSSASIFGDLPEHAYLLSPTVGSESSPWDLSNDQSAPDPTPIVRRPSPVRNAMLSSRFNNSYCISLPLLHRPEVKEEEVDESLLPTVSTPELRTYTNMNSLTRQNEVERKRVEMSNHSLFPMVLMQMPLMQKPRSVQEKPKAPSDAQTINNTAPNVPEATPTESTNEQLDVAPNKNKQQQSKNHLSEVESDEGDTTASPSTSPGSASKFEGYIRRARASQAAVAEAAKAEPTGSKNSVDSITQQFERTHISSQQPTPTTKPPATRPVMEGGLARKMKAAKARTLCSNNPERRRHAELVVELMKGINALQMARRLKEAQIWNTSRSMYPQAATSPQQEKQQPATQRPTDLDYSRLRSTLEDHEIPVNSVQEPSVLDEEPITADSPVIYPISEIHKTSAAPFELSEEERRFIEEDNAKTAAEAAARSKDSERK